MRSSKRTELHPSNSGCSCDLLTYLVLLLKKIIIIVINYVHVQELCMQTQHHYYVYIAVFLLMLKCPALSCGCADYHVTWPGRIYATSERIPVTNLVGEAESYAEEDPVEEQHVDVDGCPAEDGAGDEDAAADEYGGAPAEPPCDGGGEERGDEAGDVEGGGEDGEELAVEAAVVAHLLVPSHLVVHVREELAEEGLHGGNPTWQWHLVTCFDS